MRKLIGNTLLGLLLIVVLVAAGGYLYLRTSLPQTNGSVRLAGLDGAVEVVRDDAGVPHIFASTDHDAFFALGYVHAQDRMWQMEMNRRIGNGRLSEVVGEAGLEIDKFQRTLGYARLVRPAFEALSQPSRQALEAYAAGVNAWIDQGHTLPPEFLILGVKPEPWSVYDSLVWAKMMAWDLGGDYDLELLRTRLLQALGSERLAQILPAYPQDGVDILTASEQDALIGVNKMLEIDSAIQTHLHMGGREVGSNDWVIAGARSESGKPLLADDPHLGASIPSIWYLAEIQGDKLHARGATLPGLPAIVIGHNEHIAWGVTNLNPDVQDLYIEKINPANPNQYEVGGQWQDMQIFPEEIRIDGEEEPLQWAARWTRHGPLLSDVADTQTPLAMRWTALDAEDTTMDAYFQINYAQNWEEFRQAMRFYIAPSQNFVFADMEGNIGYFGPGRMPIRVRGDGMLPTPGWNSEHEWTGWIPFEDLPQAFNPADGYVATANNRVVDDSYPYLISNDWAEPYRAERIVELIQQMSAGGEKISVEDMALIQGDQTSAQVRQALPLLLAFTPQDERQSQALELLRGWNGEASLESVASSIYEVWMYELTRALFADDLRGDLYEQMSTRYNPSFVFTALTDPQAGGVWCDNVLSAPRESCEESALKALDKALDLLEERLGKEMSRWQWQRLHTLEHSHRPFSDVAALKWLFHRSIPNGGNRYTVNVGPASWSRPFEQRDVPSYRQIIDLADLNNSRFSQTTGQSGNVLSRHYDDFVEMHRDVQYLRPSFGRDQAQGATLRLEKP